MASPNQEQALYEVSQILRGDEEARLNFERHASMRTLGFYNPNATEAWKSNPSRDITRIHLSRGVYFVENIRLALLKEAVGLGPRRYCVCFERTPLFYVNLMLVMTYLPRHKMFMYPTGTRLEGPFLREPWLSRERVICSRPTLTLDEYNTNFVTP